MVTPRRAVFAEGSGKSAVDSSHVVVVVVVVLHRRRERRAAFAASAAGNDRPTDRPTGGRSEKISSP